MMHYIEVSVIADSASLSSASFYKRINFKALLWSSICSRQWVSVLDWQRKTAGISSGLAQANSGYQWVSGFIVSFSSSFISSAADNENQFWFLHRHL